eukprot:TRINITY_DN2989_c0_g1_i1.p1 TRINITY_DN2989_c0_g1~~TRINITY_DN2989_c0_g1_i1.p1  ORF type:complete len:540 (-),score=125.93 TRINITY_DN2989_c0_g1_i1:81-1700(-)
MQGDRAGSGWRRGASSENALAGAPDSSSLSSSGGASSQLSAPAAASAPANNKDFSNTKPKLDGTYVCASNTMIKRSNGKPFVLGELLFKEDGTVMCVYNYKSVVPEEGRETALSPIGVTVTSRWKLLGNHGIVADSFSGYFSSAGNNLHLHMYDERSGAKLNSLPFFFHYVSCAEVPYGTKQAEEGIILTNEEFEWNNKLSLRFVADDADHNLDAEGWEDYLKKPEPTTSSISSSPSGGRVSVEITTVSSSQGSPRPLDQVGKQPGTGAGAARVEAGDDSDASRKGGVMSGVAGMGATASNFFGRKSHDPKKTKKKKSSGGSLALSSKDNSSPTSNANTSSATASYSTSPTTHNAQQQRPASLSATTTGASPTASTPTVSSPILTSSSAQPVQKKRGTAISGKFYLYPRRRGTHQPKTAKEPEIPNMQTTLFAINRDPAVTQPAPEELTRPIKGSYLLIKRGGDKASVQSGYWVINLTTSGEDGHEFAKYWPTNAEKYGGDPSSNQKAARGFVFDSRILFMDKKGRTCTFNVDPLAAFQ